MRVCPHFWSPRLPSGHKSCYPWWQISTSVHELGQLQQRGRSIYPFLWCCGGGTSFGQSLPSIISIEYVMPLTLQHTEWHSLPIGWDFCCTIIHLGQVHWFIHTNINSSRQLIHAVLKHPCLSTLNARIKSIAGWTKGISSRKRCLPFIHQIRVPHVVLRSIASILFDLPPLLVHDLVINM